MTTRAPPANLVRALDVNPLEGLPPPLLEKLLADPSDPNAEAPSEADLAFADAHAASRVAEATAAAEAILLEKPQSVHTLEQATGLTPIMIACQSGNTAHVSLLLKAMASWRARREAEEWAKEDAEAAAASADCAKKPKTAEGSALEESSPVEGSPQPKRQYKYIFRNPTINRHDASGFAPIHHCIYGGNADILAMLLGAEEREKAAPTEGADRSKEATTDSGAHSGTNSSAHGVDVNLSTVYVPSLKPTGETPLHLAVRLAGVAGPDASKNGQTHFITAGKSEEETKEEGGASPTIAADLRIVQLLLEHGALPSLNAKDDRGRTPLGQLSSRAPANAMEAAVIALLESLGGKR